MTTPRLPTDPAARKALALAAFMDYFPDAVAEVSKVIRQGQIQHNTQGWDRTKSTDQHDCLLRHFIDRGTVDTDGLRHSAKLAWRALAALQIELEAELGLPPPRGVSVPAEEELDEFRRLDFAEERKRRQTAAYDRLHAVYDKVVQENQAALNIVAPEATQLELPFTGKQLSIADLYNELEGAEVRVVADDNPHGSKNCPRVGDVVTLVGPGFGDDCIELRTREGLIVSLTNPGWRFERI